LVPSATTIAILINPASGVATEPQLKDLQAAAREVGQQLQFVNAQTESELDSAFAMIGQSTSKALLVTADVFFNSRRDQIISLAARYAIPTIYDLREFVLSGGLMSYGTSLTNAYRQVGVYSGRILRGDKPGDLPVMQSTKFEFAINLKTGKALGLSLPPGLLSIADPRDANSTAPIVRFLLSIRGAGAIEVPKAWRERLPRFTTFPHQVLLRSGRQFFKSAGDRRGVADCDGPFDG
jgi:putative ABC transport system substrate-binding protein